MKFGRLPRKYDPRVPHLSALTASRVPEPAPLAVDYTAGMPGAFGAMLNDSLGDCTCAAYYHARQVWTFCAGHAEITEPDADVLMLYEQACGYSPSNPASDQGGVEQDVLAYLLNTGAPVGPTGAAREKLLAYVEIDQTRHEIVRRVIADCGGAYIGFNVPSTIWSDGDTWSTTSSQKIIGGHAVFLAGYDQTSFFAISWGRIYRMTFEFFGAYCDEAYALIDPAWVEKTGLTPCGLDLPALEAAMAALKEAP